MKTLIEKHGSFTDAEITTFDFSKRAISAALLPKRVNDTNNDVFLREDQVGLVCLTFVGVGVALGDKFGDSIPVLGGGR